MELLNLILLILLILFIFSFVFRILWILMPFILIAMGVLYLKNRLSSKPNQKQNRNTNQTSTRSSEDVVDVEFKVRDSDEDH